MDAAVFSTPDRMREVSANVLVGQLCQLGTNAFDLLLDETRLLHVPVGGVSRRRPSDGCCPAGFAPPPLPLPPPPQVHACTCCVCCANRCHATPSTLACP